MKLILEDNYYKNTSGPVSTWTAVSRSVSWDSIREDKTNLENDLPMIFEYLKQYQNGLKVRARCAMSWDQQIPKAKVEHIDKLLKTYKPLYTKSWEWDCRL